jgi:hypothetical protein
VPKLLIIIAGAVVIAAVAFILLFTRPCACEHDELPATPQANVITTPPPLPTACGANPAPAVSVAPTEFGYRQVAAPAKDAPVSSPLRVSGQANPFEGAFSVTILDRQGRRVAADDYLKDNRNLAFAVALPFEVVQPMPACVWVHERSGRDGSPTNITQIPVLLLP